MTGETQFFSEGVKMDLICEALWGIRGVAKLECEI